MFAHTINAPFITIGAYIYSFVSCRVLTNDVYFLNGMKDEKIPMSSRLFGILFAFWWLRGDSNPRHTGYEPVALTNWATQPSYLVELTGLEPATSCLQSTRSPS